MNGSTKWRSRGSAITFWELALLHEKGRMRILADMRSWRATLLDDGLIEIPVDGDMGIRANGLVNFHVDPADRIIVATALEGHQLVTADQRILDWPGNTAGRKNVTGGIDTPLAERSRIVKYAVVIEKGPTSYGAHVPDLPGCVAAAETRDEVCALINEAIELYVEALEEDGLPVPEPHYL